MITLQSIADALYQSGHRSEFVAMQKLIRLLPEWVVRRWEQTL